MGGSRPNRLPSLKALLAFEATARNLSISRAAKELNLTASAVSYSISVLEAQLHNKLFQRGRNGVVLTGTGRQFLGTAQAALVLMESAFAAPPSGPRDLAISVLPSFATRWLIPRLPRLLAHAPDIRFEIQSIQVLTEFDIEHSADVGIRIGSGDWPALETIKLANERLVAVASPAYRQGRLPTAPEELAKCELIFNPRTPWSLWANQFGLRLSEKDTVLSIDDTSMAIQVAVAGLGIALARGLMVADELASGRLVPLFQSVEIVDRGYWLAWPKNTRKRALIDRLAAWLSQELSNTTRGD
ncbi:MAG TPA: LysR substrate-binding domain-containing protein [Steroidobacteraceae bacterium]|nr:LysR substrate-binding domain-containing protein [Steroidobacteraceae bacterium]